MRQLRRGRDIHTLWYCHADTSGVSGQHWWYIFWIYGTKIETDYTRCKLQVNTLIETKSKYTLKISWSWETRKHHRSSAGTGCIRHRKAQYLITRRQQESLTKHPNQEQYDNEATPNTTISTHRLNAIKTNMELRPRKELNKRSC